MAGSRKPGPLCLDRGVQDLNDGTMIRGLSPRPGPLGAKAASMVSIHGNPSVTPLAAPTPRQKSSAVAFQALRQGSRGPQVQKLQRQLNARLAPSPKLAVDGIFGPLTQQAVLQYQRGVSITPDGVVGKRTWYHLLKGEKANVPQVSVPGTQPLAKGTAAGPKSPPEAPPYHAASAPAPAAGIWELTLAEKFAEALRRTAPKLPAGMRHEFEALLSPTSLGVMVGTLVVWAGSHAFGVGEVVDVVLLIGGAIFLGMAVFDVAGELADFLVETSTAADEEDLDEAATHLAKAIAVIGVAAFFALLAKVARGRGGKGGVAEGPKAQPKVDPGKPKMVESQAKAKPASKPTVKTPAGLDKGLSDRIRAMDKGKRPDPRTYMSEEQIRLHAKEFEGGASRLMLKGNLDKYGPAQRDGTSFVAPKKDIDKLLRQANGDKRALERSLGLPEGILDADQLVRVDVPNPKAVNLRIPSGNEAGANSQWLPGGRLPEGTFEAVVDLQGAPKGTWTATPIDF